ncbi:MAG TPA: type II secretion system protein [Phycisphaerae bacterium]|nr:type II secretion system protein [Phycisphaerae bacterium]HRY68667.1 type II secretion system protein [Phycisphaerae bacterium]HSA25493.1 type II secretion system protein [Phycisphaerae bacterium]
MSNRYDRRGFTLIEVLVVVAIIALLISVLIPSLSRSRDQAQAVVCKTRLRELYSGHNFYAQDNKSRFPHWDWWLWDGISGGNAAYLGDPYRKFGGTRPTDSGLWVTFGQIYKFVRNKEVYFCPKDTKRRFAAAVGSGESGRGNRAIHSYVRFIEPHNAIDQHRNNGSSSSGLASADFLSPDELKPGIFSKSSVDYAGKFYSTPNKVGMLFEEYPGFDDTTLSPNASNAGSALNDGYSGYYDFVDWMAGRHFAKGTVLYWDGHTDMVETKKFNTSDKYASYMVLGGPKP